MNITRRWAAKALASGVLAACGGASQAQRLEPYGVAVAYDAAANSATLSWASDPPAVYGFRIERRPIGGSWRQLAYLSDATRRSHTSTGLAPLTRYEYRVVSFRPGGPAEGYPSGVVATRLDFPYAAAYPFGQLPSNFTRAQMNDHVRTMYTAWRNRYVTAAGAGPGGKRVYKPAENGETVSEGMGYGMLISAYMDDGANGGKADFDALFTYYQSKKIVRPDGMRDLMAWRVDQNGVIASKDNMSATDGDLDAAYALLVADKKWGSSGAINYKAEAIKVINALMDHNVLNRAPTASGLFFGRDKPNLTDAEWSSGYIDYSFSSYQMAGYVEAFAAASDSAGDSVRAAKWRAMKPELYKFYDYFYNRQVTVNGVSFNTGLFPYTFSTPPGSMQYQASTNPGTGYNFGYDASRVPWRVATDYLWHGTATAEAAQLKYPSIAADLARRLPTIQANWFFGALGGQRNANGTVTTVPEPQLAYESYELDGSVTPGKTRQGHRSMVSSMAVGAMTDPSNQAFLNLLYDWMRQQVPGQSFTRAGVTVNPSYYGDAVLMTTLLMVTGNMPNLVEVPVPAN